VCAVSEALHSVSDEHYTEFCNSSVSDEEKGRHALWGRVSYVKKRETHVMSVHLLCQKREMCAMGARLPFISHSQKRLPTEYSPQDNFLRHSACQRKKQCVEDKLSKIFKAL
jgi:hypothetical protein